MYAIDGKYINKQIIEHMENKQLSPTSPLFAINGVAEQLLRGEYPPATNLLFLNGSKKNGGEIKYIDNNLNMQNNMDNGNINISANGAIQLTGKVVEVQNGKLIFKDSRIENTYRNCLDILNFEGNTNIHAYKGDVKLTSKDSTLILNNNSCKIGNNNNTTQLCLDNVCINRSHFEKLKNDKYIEVDKDYYSYLGKYDLCARDSYDYPTYNRKCDGARDSEKIFKLSKLKK